MSGALPIRRGGQLAALALAAGIAAAWFVYRGHRAGLLAELPDVDLSKANAQVRTTIEKARQAVVDAPDSASKWGLLGMSLQAHDFHQQSNVCLRRAMQLDEEDFLWAYLLGSNLSVRDPLEAERCFRLASRSQPDRALPHIRLAEMYLEQRRLDAAHDEYEAALRLEPGDARIRFGLGQVALARGDAEAARQWAEQSLARAPNRRETAELLLRSLHRLGDTAAAERQRAIVDRMPRGNVDWDDPYEEQVRRMRRDPGSEASIATDLIEQGRIPEAVWSLERLVASDPDNPQWHSLLGMAHLRSRDRTRAAAVLDAALERFPESAELHFQRGVAWFFSEEWDQAAGAFRRALGLKPDFRDARYNLAHTLVKLGDREGAMAAFREVIRVRPNDAASRTNLAKLLLDAGEVDSARIELETAARLAPNDPQTRQLLERLEGNE